MAEREPRAFVTQAPALTIDEVQRTPELLLAIKEAVDEDPAAGRFVLTGSANLLLMQRIGESLAGRARYLTLWPMTRPEQLGMGEAGCWSALFDAPHTAWPAILESQAAPRDSWRALAARVMRGVCERLGQVIQQSDLARDVGLPRTTVQRYLNLLEVSYQLVRVDAYAVNRTKRLVKSPKYYWSDTGLALHLTGSTDPGGAHLENIVLTDLLAWRETDVSRPNVFYWRTSTGEEVDFVVERKNRTIAVEVKATTNPGYGDARHVRTFLREYGSASLGGLLLHDGENVSWIPSGCSPCRGGP